MTYSAPHVISYSSPLKARKDPIGHELNVDGQGLFSVIEAKLNVHGYVRVH